MKPRTAARRAEAARLRAAGQTLEQIAATMRLSSVQSARYYLTPPRTGPRPPRVRLHRWQGTFPEDVYDALRQRAAAQGVTINSLVVAAVVATLPPDPC